VVEVRRDAEPGQAAAEDADGHPLSLASSLAPSARNIRTVSFV
jgi:hypothetical protein